MPCNPPAAVQFGPVGAECQSLTLTILAQSWSLQIDVAQLQPFNLGDTRPAVSVPLVPIINPGSAQIVRVD